ncbi:hypothetical protein KL929_000043 [Ogataea haglerorum]|nr:hypothetical protein KL929_000043 [Ogataea haglerorum]
MVSAYARYFAPTWAVVATIFGVFLLMETFATPFHRHFYVPDPRISYPYTADSVPDARLAVYTCVGPCVLIALATATQYLRSARDQKQRAVHLASVSCLALALALGLNGLVTEFIKIKVGWPRPDFLDRKSAPGRPEIVPVGPLVVRVVRDEFPELVDLRPVQAVRGPRGLFPEQAGAAGAGARGSPYLHQPLAGLQAQRAGHHVRVAAGAGGVVVGVPPVLPALGGRELRPAARARAGARATGVAGCLHKQRF